MSLDQRNLPIQQGVDDQESSISHQESTTDPVSGELYYFRGKVGLESASPTGG